MAKLSTKELEESDLEGLTKEVLHTSDRTAAIVLAAWVERELEQWIIATLPRNDKKTIEKLQGRDGALNSFYGKIHLGYALGVYDEIERENLDIIRRIRNEFAHTPQAIDFETDEIRKEVENLRLPTASSIRPELAALSEHRRRFSRACAVVVVRSRLEPVLEGLHFLRSLYEAFDPATGDLTRPLDPDASQKLSKTVKALERIANRDMQ
jgi:DNA-binding MltR family transcriptional regulator